MDPQNTTTNGTMVVNTAEVPGAASSSPQSSKPGWKRLRIIGPLLVIIILLVFVPSLFLMKKIFTASRTPIPTPSAKKITDQEVILTKGKPMTIGGTDIALTLLSSIKPPATCYDCTASTKVEVKKGSQRTLITYACGGFNADCNFVKKDYGITIKLKDQIDTEHVSVMVTR